MLLVMLVTTCMTLKESSGKYTLVAKFVDTILLRSNFMIS